RRAYLKEHKMGKNIMFNTLSYAKMLDNGGIERADVHAAALHEALAQNIFTKSEVEQMLETALKRFDERTVQLREEIHKDFHKIHMDIKDLRLEIKDVQDNILKRGYTALAVVLAVIALSSNPTALCAIVN
ncbi:MAG: hypothetical protein ACK4PR_08135, partial [Gammaproteobacteria bacterium]